MEQEKINLYDVIESLAEQNKAKDITIGYKDAALKSRDEKIKGLEEEVEQLRKELIGKMDEESGKEK